MINSKYYEWISHYVWQNNVNAKRLKKLHIFMSAMFLLSASMLKYLSIKYDLSSEKMPLCIIQQSKFSHLLNCNSSFSYLPKGCANFARTYLFLLKQINLAETVATFTEHLSWNTIIHTGWNYSQTYLFH